MNQKDHFRATRLDSLARFRESDRVAPVQEQNRILCSKLLGNGTADSAAGACDEVTLHEPTRKVSPRTTTLKSRSLHQKSGARTHRTPTALRAKSCENPVLFREAFGVRTRPRVALNLVRQFVAR